MPPIGETEKGASVIERAEDSASGGMAAVHNPQANVGLKGDRGDKGDAGRDGRNGLDGKDGLGLTPEQERVLQAVIKETKPVLFGLSLRQATAIGLVATTLLAIAALLAATVR